jgi:hypothetical protein
MSTDTNQLGNCRWFAMCENAATGTMPHPVLGDVPICDRCRAVAEKNKADRRTRG